MSNASTPDATQPAPPDDAAVLEIADLDAVTGGRGHCGNARRHHGGHHRGGQHHWGHGGHGHGGRSRGFGALAHSLNRLSYSIDRFGRTMR